MLLLVLQYLLHGIQECIQITQIAPEIVIKEDHVHVGRKMKTREQIILSMCYTYRHDYGLDKIPSAPLSCGITESERQYIHHMMSQIFDNDIAPNMDFKPDQSS